MASGLKTFDIALSVNVNNEYLNVITGPIIYDHSTKSIQIGEIEPYLIGDMNAIKKASAETIFELVTAKYIDSYHQNGSNVNSFFTKVSKLQLFNFANEKSWKHHRNGQKHTKYDIVIIANNKNQPQYTLHEVTINVLSHSIMCKLHQMYQTNDYKQLNELAQKQKTIQIDQNWQYSFLQQAHPTFKTAICYNFNSDLNKTKFFEQSFDFGIITNTENQPKWIIVGIKYIYFENIIVFKSCIPYKNGYYAKLKECAEQIKISQPEYYKMCSEQNQKYDFADTDNVIDKCLLFRVKNDDLWLDFVYLSCTDYDVGVVLDKDEKQSYFLNKIKVNWIDKEIAVGAAEKYMPKHMGLINKFGEQCDEIINLQTFKMPENIKKNTLKSAIFYRWNPHKKENKDCDMQKTVEKRKGSKTKKKKKGSVAVNHRRKDSLIRPSVMKKQKRISIKEKKKKKSKKVKSKSTKNNRTNAKNKKENVQKPKKPKANGKQRVQKVTKKKKKNKEKLKKVKSRKTTLDGTKASKSTKNSHQSKRAMIEGKNENKTNQAHDGTNVDHLKTNADVHQNDGIENHENTSNAHNSKAMLITDGLKTEPMKVSKTQNIIKVEAVVNAESDIESNGNKIWALYVQRYGNAPKDVNKLLNFSKQNANTTNLSYKQARQLFKDKAK